MTSAFFELLQMVSEPTQYIPYGLRHMDPNENVRDLSREDCNAPSFDKCVCLLSPISGTYWVERNFINNCKESKIRNRYINQTSNY